MSQVSRPVVTVWFALNGLVTASWIAHIPDVSVKLGVSPAILGLTLLCMTIGSVLGMAAAPRTIRRYGAGRAAAIAGIVFTCCLLFPFSANSVQLLALGLVLFGLTRGLFDVAMNTAAAECEQAMGRPVMASFHGWFSLGMLAGVAVGAATLLADVPALFHAVAVSAVPWASSQHCCRQELRHAPSQSKHPVQQTLVLRAV